MAEQFDEYAYRLAPSSGGVAPTAGYILTPGGGLRIIRVPPQRSPHQHQQGPAAVLTAVDDSGLITGPTVGGGPGRNVCYYQTPGAPGTPGGGGQYYQVHDQPAQRRVYRIGPRYNADVIADSPNSKSVLYVQYW